MSRTKTSYENMETLAQLKHISLMVQSEYVKYSKNMLQTRFKKIVEEMKKKQIDKNIKLLFIFTTRYLQSQLRSIKSHNNMIPQNTNTNSIFIEDNSRNIKDKTKNIDKYIRIKGEKCKHCNKEPIKANYGFCEDHRKCKLNKA